MPVIDGTLCAAVCACRTSLFAKPRRVMPVAHGIKEEMPVCTVGPDGQPVAQDTAGFLPQRQDAFPPAFADDVHLVEGRYLQVVERKPDQFRDPQAGVVGETQHRAVPYSSRRTRVRRVEQRTRLRPVERADERHFALLGRDFAHLRGKVEISRAPELKEVEEGFDGRKPGIARTHPVSPNLFEMFEELEKGRYVEMTDLKLAGPDAVFVRCEDNQQLEAEGVTFNGKPARAPVAWKILPQEHRQRGSEISHRSPSPRVAVRLPATPA